MIGFLVWLHISLLILGVICVAINTLVINLSRNKHERVLPRVVIMVLSSRTLRSVLLLPEIVKVCTTLCTYLILKFHCTYLLKHVSLFSILQTGESIEYGKLKETHTDTKATSTTQDTWVLLGIFIDRISFILLFSIFVAAVALRY